MKGSEHSEGSENSRRPEQHEAGGAGNLRRDADFGKVGDSTSNQHWTQMTGAHQQHSELNSPGAGSQTDGQKGQLDFGSHDIYGGAGRGTGTGLDKGGEDRGKAGPGSDKGAEDRGQVGPGSVKGAEDRDKGSPGSDKNDQHIGQVHGAGAHGPGHAQGLESQAGARENGPPGSGKDVRQLPGGEGRGTGNDGSLKAAGKDAQPDLNRDTDKAQNAMPPELKTPTPDQMLNAPVSDLQSMARDSHASLQNYVQEHPMPPVGFHGSNALNGNSLANNQQRGGEIWVAGPNPDRQGLGTSQYMGDLSVSVQTSIDYAQTAKGGEPGPVHIYDMSNQPEAWNKTSYDRKGSSVNGNSTEDVAKFGKLDLDRAQMIGSISRDQLDAHNDQFGQLDSALKGRQSELLSMPWGPNPDKVDDLLARANALTEIKRAHELKMVLDAVAKSDQQNWQ